MVTANGKIYKKKHKYDEFKTSKQQIDTVTYTKNQKCNACALKEEKYQFVTKK